MQYGSVTLNGKLTNEYNYDEASRVLTVKVGDLGVEESATVTFVAVVNTAAYGKTIYNTAVMKLSLIHISLTSWQVVSGSNSLNGISSKPFLPNSVTIKRMSSKFISFAKMINMQRANPCPRITVREMPER